MPSWPPAPWAPSQCCPRRVSDTPALPALSWGSHPLPRPARQPLAGCPLTSRGHRSSVTSGSRAQSQGGEGVPEGVRPVAGGVPRGPARDTGRGSSPRTLPGVSWARCPGWGLGGPPGGCSAHEQRGQWRVETVAVVREPGTQVGWGRPLHRWGSGQRRSQACAESTPHPSLSPP